MDRRQGAGDAAAPDSSSTSRTIRPALHVVEALRGKSGYLTLTRLVIDSYEREEYLLFSGFDDDGGRSIRRRWRSSSTVTRHVGRRRRAIPRHTERAGGGSRAAREGHGQPLARSRTARTSTQAREKLEKWADDMVLAAEKALQDTKEQIKVLRRQARQADDARGAARRFRRRSRSWNASSAASGRTSSRPRTRSWRSATR